MIAIAKLKREARKHYLAVSDIADTYDCGFSVAMLINPTLAQHAAEFNRVMGELAKLDPNAPSFRYQLQ